MAQIAIRCARDGAALGKRQLLVTHSSSHSVPMGPLGRGDPEGDGARLGDRRNSGNHWSIELTEQTNPGDCSQTTPPYAP